MRAKHAILRACKYLIRTIPIAVELSGLETAVSQTILTVPLSSIDEVEGLKRTRCSPGQFHHPLGASTLPFEEDRRSRL